MKEAATWLKLSTRCNVSLLAGATNGDVSRRRGNFLPEGIVQFLFDAVHLLSARNDLAAEGKRLNDQPPNQGTTGN